ncbi:ABC transporter ATP-binding protein [Mobilicoccus caccae]|uniref:ABC transporter ATP-binding protein n=1 Tax=Mobilicoccus caccae TaxID=1859295 RepID=A0ABQ6IN19_9MICO|nr:ABC transporter ATP-binding protein [Mobilicoccus caccae]GMA38826.1 ABC transporter ATP-binding protein [Mobilicoccus caccae]
MTTTSGSTTRLTGTPAVHVSGLVKTFPAPRGGTPIEAVRGVDLHIERGEVVALLGPNGAGKTTLLDMVLGFTEPDAGTLAVLGDAPAEAIARGGVSSVMQTGGLLPLLTVGETLDMVADLYGRRDAVARRAGVASLLRRRVSKCSGGEQQRLRFALALLPDPELLLLDEPTTGLDVSGRRAFWDAIRADADSGRTIVFATHYLAEADDIADRIVLLSGGRIVADGTPARIKGTALGRVVRVTLPADDSTDAALRERPDVTAWERHGDVVEIRTSDSDALARHLLTHTGARDLEVTSTALDDAFVALTGSDPS